MCKASKWWLSLKPKRIHKHKALASSTWSWFGLIFELYPYVPCWSFTSSLQTDGPLTWAKVRSSSFRWGPESFQNCKCSPDYRVPLEKMTASDGKETEVLEWHQICTEIPLLSKHCPPSATNFRSPELATIGSRQLSVACQNWIWWNSTLVPWWHLLDSVVTDASR